MSYAVSCGAIGLTTRALSLTGTAKARAVLQTAFYSRLLAELQWIEPRWMHLALGHGEFVSVKVRDFAAYEGQTRRRPAG